MNNKKISTKFFKSSEEIVSMILGLVIVAVIVGLIVNYFQKHRGVINIPGISDQNKLELSADKLSEDKIDGAKLGLNGGEYIVKKGDSLWKIALEQTGSGYNWTQISKANNIKNPGVLEKDQKLNIPKIEQKNVEIKKEVVDSIKPGTTYTVVRGDSLWKIAVKSYGDGYKWTTIWKNNSKLIREPNKLEIGMKLTI